MALRIRIEHGQDAGKTLRLATPGRYKFGRQPGLSLQVLDMKVSKEHFEILVPNGQSAGMGIKDLNSSHGTWLNGQKVNGARPLVAGDEIRIGMTVLRVMSDGPADTEVKGHEPIPTESEWIPAAPAAGAAVAAHSGAGSASGTSSAAASKMSGSTPGVTTTSMSGSKAGNGGQPAKPPAPPDPLVGTTLAGYQVLERVGAGGMGAVYKAEQLSLHREVALKVLAERLVSDSAFVDQFVNEARAAGALNHPNVVQVYDVGHADGHHYFSMEYIHGGSLEDRLKAGKGASWQDALPWFLDAANALFFAERKGILHRDIKPDNLMLSQDGSVKLCDLGLAKKSESADLLAQGIIGTPHFIAPEAVRRKTDVDKRADLYSLGCTFYRILTGKNPFPGASVKEILLAHLNTPPPHVTAIATDVPKEIDEVIFKLMQKEPAARFQGAEELWKALDKIRLQHGLEAHGLHPGLARKWVILGSTIAIAAIGVAVYFVAKPKEVEIHEKIIERPGVTYGPGASPRDVLAQNARIDFGAIENDALKTIGRLEDGENWKSSEWPKIVRRYRDLAANKEYEGFEQAKNATAEADKIEQYIARKKSDVASLSERTGAAAARLNDLLLKFEGALAPLMKPARKYPEAAALISLTQTDLQAMLDDKPVLLTEKQIADAKKKVADARKAVEGDVEEDYQAVLRLAREAEGLDTAEALKKAIKIFEDFLARVPPTKGDDSLAQKINAVAAQATAAKESDAGKVEKRQLTELAHDRDEYWRLLHPLYGVRNADGSAGGPYAMFRFEAGKTAIEAAMRATLTPEYRALLKARLDDVQGAISLFAALNKSFADKPWDDKVQAPGMTSPAKVDEIKPEGFTAGGKTRFFQECGIGWVLANLFHNAKGEERFAFSAADHAALGAMAEAGIIVDADPKAMLDMATAEWEKAAAMDPESAARLDARRRRALREKAARDLIDAATKAVADVNLDMDQYDPSKITPALWEKRKPDVPVRQKDWTDKLAAARKALADCEQQYADTFLWAVMADAPPAAARYAGEAAPPPPPVAPPPGPAAGGKPPGGGRRGGGTPPPGPVVPPAPPPGPPNPPNPPNPPDAPMDGGDAGMDAGMDGSGMSDSPPAPGK